jgi:hypothetical protein
MRNLEQTIAKKLLNEYMEIQHLLENFKHTKNERLIIYGKESLIMDIAQSIWGSDELNMRSHFWFVDTLKEIENSEPKANLVEVSRFEAFAMFKDYGVKSVNARHEGLEGLADTYSERSDKWLDIATKIEQTNADGFNKDLMHI